MERQNPTKTYFTQIFIALLGILKNYSYLCAVVR